MISSSGTSEGPHHRLRNVIIFQTGCGDQTGGGDRTGGGAQTEGVISLTNKDISISYLIVITQVCFFFKISNPPPLFQKKAEPQQFYQLRLPHNPEQPYQSFYT